MGKKEKTGPRARDEGIRLIQKAQEKVTKSGQENPHGGFNLRALVEAEDMANRALKLFRASNDPDPRYVCFGLRDLGFYQSLQGKADQAEETYKQGLKIFEEIQATKPLTSEQEKVLGLLEKEMAQLYWDTYRPKEACTLFHQVLTRGDIGNLSELGCHRYLAQIYLKRGDLDKAFDHGMSALGCFDAMVVHQEATDPAVKLMVLSTLGDIAEAREDDVGMTRYDNEALQLGRHLGELENMAMLIEPRRRRALAFMEKGDLERAEASLFPIVALYRNLTSDGYPTSHSDELHSALKALDILVDVLKKCDKEAEAQLLRQELDDMNALVESMRGVLLEDTRKEMREKSGVKKLSRNQRKRKAKQKKKQAAQQEEEKKADGASVQGEKEGATPAAAEEKDEAEGEGEEEEEGGTKAECSVCLCSVEEKGVPELVCGHTYHSACLHVWVEKCKTVGLLPTCSNCRSSVVEL